MCLCMSLGFRIWFFLYFCSWTCMFVSLHIHICLSVWVCACFPTCLSLLILTWTFASASECVHVFVMTSVWAGRFACASGHISFEFLWEDAITRICMYLEVSNSSETSDSLKYQASQGWNLMLENGWTVPLLRPSWLRKWFSSKMRFAVSPKDPFCLPRPHLDLQDPFSAHF